MHFRSNQRLSRETWSTFSRKGYSRYWENKDLDYFCFQNSYENLRAAANNPVVFITLKLWFQCKTTAPTVPGGISCLSRISEVNGVGMFGLLGFALSYRRSSFWCLFVYFDWSFLIATFRTLDTYYLTVTKASVSKSLGSILTFLLSSLQISVTLLLITNVRVVLAYDCHQ